MTPPRHIGLAPHRRRPPNPPIPGEWLALWAPHIVAAAAVWGALVVCGGSWAAEGGRGPATLPAHLALLESRPGDA